MREYVDLRDLRDAEVAEQEYIQIGGGHQLAVQKKGSRKEITSIHEWNVLFARLQIRYSCIDRKTQLMLFRHAEWMNDCVFKAAYTEASLISYDRALRKKWHAGNIDSLASHDLGRINSSSTRKRPRGRETRTCNDWEADKDCGYTNCRFQHACGKCGNKSHKTKDCTKSKNG